MIDYAAKFEQGLSYPDFLSKYGSPDQQRQWKMVHERCMLTAEQKSFLENIDRDLKLLCLSGTWCGDCVDQCPILDHFARANSRIALRFFDRDDNPDLGAELKVCGGARVPIVVFLSEDFQELGRYGDRSLARYRWLASRSLKGVATTAHVPLIDDPLQNTIQDWLNELERAYWIVRLSPRLRQKHRD